MFESWIENNCAEDIDIYHQFSCHSTTAYLFDFFAAQNKPVIVSTVYNNSKSLKSWMANVLSDLGIPILSHKAVKSMLRRSTAIISLGNEETVDIKEYSGTQADIFNVPNGVSQAVLEFNLSSIEKQDYIVCIGTINKRKNTLALIHACEELNIPLIHIGPDSPTEKEYVKQCKEESTSCTFKGFLDNDSSQFLSLVAQAKLMVLPSHNEVLPISVFEALILGTPVVSTQNSSLGTYLTESDGCKLCNPKSMTDIKKSIQKMYGKPISTEQINSFKNDYNWLTVAKRIEEIYYRYVP